MRYFLFIDVQKNLVTGEAAIPGAREVASRIVDCAYRLKDADGCYAYATRLTDGTEESELFSCLGSIVDGRGVRSGGLSELIGLELKMAAFGKPDEIVVCGLGTSGMVLVAALLMRTFHPSAKVSILGDLTCDKSEGDKAAALIVARNNGVSVIEGDGGLV